MRRLAPLAWAALVLAFAVPDLLPHGAPPLTGQPPAATSTVIPGMTLSRLSVRSVMPQAPGTLRVGVLRPEHPVADVLFVHGHADRLDNHRRLFEAWAAAGYRVIAFDLPSHGESDVLPIDVWTFPDLYALVRLVERATVEDFRRPLVLSGWSFGGLVLTRMAQDRAALARAPRALVLLNPVVAPLPFTGGDGVARTRTLTHDPRPPVAGPPSPASPLLDPVFVARLLWQATLAEHSELPGGLPTLVMAAGLEDEYVDAAGLLAWARTQRRSGVAMEIRQCPGARHALDLEPYPVGPAVDAVTTRFVAGTLGLAAPAGGAAEAACPAR